MADLLDKIIKDLEMEKDKSNKQFTKNIGKFLGHLNHDLFLILFILKLGDHLTLSWWWVFAPFWVPLILLGVLAVILNTIGKKE